MIRYDVAPLTPVQLNAGRSSWLVAPLTGVLRPGAGKLTAAVVKLNGVAQFPSCVALRALTCHQYVVPACRSKPGVNDGPTGVSLSTHPAQVSPPGLVGRAA